MLIDGTNALYVTLNLRLYKYIKEREKENHQTKQESSFLTVVTISVGLTSSIRFGTESGAKLYTLRKYF